MEVRVHQPNIGRRTITGFPSIAEAEHWIEIQKRHQPPVGLGPQLSGPYTNPQARIVRPVDLPAEGRRDSGAAAACRSVCFGQDFDKIKFKDFLPSRRRPGAAHSSAGSDIL